MDEYLKTLDRMERDITPVDLTAAAASISISANRIANSLEAMELRALRSKRSFSMPSWCPGHVGHPMDLKICRYCATHVDDERSD